MLYLFESYVYGYDAFLYMYVNIFIRYLLYIYALYYNYSLISQVYCSGLPSGAAQTMTATAPKRTNVSLLDLPLSVLTMITTRYFLYELSQVDGAIYNISETPSLS